MLHPHWRPGPSMPWETVSVDNEELPAKSEDALTQIKVAQGLSERHEAVPPRCGSG
jgi:hypothetical protein